ncbi:hypothetical protein [Amycolatopsis orientalis]|nr:hypothetical protein [Amycolatopsis orientalis]
MDTTGCQISQGTKFFGRRQAKFEPRRRQPQFDQRKVVGEHASS